MVFLTLFAHRERTDYIQKQLPDALLIQSTAAPGIINFYRYGHFLS